MNYPWLRDGTIPWETVGRTWPLPGQLRVCIDWRLWPRDLHLVISVDAPWEDVLCLSYTEFPGRNIAPEFGLVTVPASRLYHCTVEVSRVFASALCGSQGGDR